MSAPNMTAPESVAADRALGKNESDADIVIPAGLDGKCEEAKEFTTMAARAAMCGCALYRLADGDLLLTRWGMARACPDLRSVAVLLDRLGGAA